MSFWLSDLNLNGLKLRERLKLGCFFFSIVIDSYSTNSGVGIEKEIYPVQVPFKFATALVFFLLLLYWPALYLLSVIHCHMTRPRLAESARKCPKVAVDLP